jgi:transposase
MAAIIGIDVSKNELIGVRINRAGKEVEKYQFENNTNAIITFLNDASQKHKHLVIACESTSYFHRNLALACIKQAIPFRLINPITTKQFVKVTVRGRKTDMSDALIIAKLALHGEGRYMLKEDFSFTKSISRTASKLSEMERSIGRMISRLSTVEDQEKYIVGDVLKICRQTLESNMKKLRKYLHKETDRTIERQLTSIPGIGLTIADILIAEIGNIDRFHSGKALVAFSGIDPRVKQSGASLKRNTRITKRGSPHLRHILYLQQL